MLEGFKSFFVGHLATKACFQFLEIQFSAVKGNKQNTQKRLRKKNKQEEIDVEEDGEEGGGEGGG